MTAMDFSRDELRRDLADSREAHRAELKELEDDVPRLLEADDAQSRSALADVLVGAFARRRFLAIGGLSVASAAVIAACGNNPPPDNVPQSGTAPATTALAKNTVSDVALLRTASSLEYSTIDVYQFAIDAGSLPADVLSGAKMFQDQHREHAKYFEGLTTQAGGEPFTKANPVVAVNIVDPGKDVITKAGSQPNLLVDFARVMEEILAGTYQSFVPQFSIPRWRGDVMSVGGIEARHAVVLAKLLPDAKVTPITQATGANDTETTTTTIKTSTTGQAVQRAPIYQIPGAFNPQSGVPLIVGTTQITVEIPGPNSYMYP
jgi:hypothetical protein